MDKYTWRDIGSSYLMSDLQAASSVGAAGSGGAHQPAAPGPVAELHYDALLPLARAGRIELPTVPADCGQNAHMFYIGCVISRIAAD